MKTMLKLPAMLVGLMLFFVATTQTAKAQQEDVSLQSFYDELSPYGTWIKDPQYGYVWRPDVDQNEFRPYYTNGRWAMTEYGNTWVSNYEWGWAPFHYGRWVYNRYNNWVWLPDTVWGPAWVSWRSGGGYYGWAPLGPSISIGINIGRGGYRVPDMCWNFIPYNNIYINNYPRYNYGRNRVYIQNTVIINNTYVRNNKTYYTGPRVDDIRRHTNQNVTVYNVNRSNRPSASRIDNNSVNLYNPRPTRGTVNNAQAEPTNAVQGSINRGVIASRDRNGVSEREEYRRRSNESFNQADRNIMSDRGNSTNVSSRSSRRGESNNTITANDNNGITPNQDRNTVWQRPSVFDRRGESNNTVTGNDNNGVTPNQDRNTVWQRPSVFDRRGSNNTQIQRVDRAPSEAQTPQRFERSREMPEQRFERQQQASQRIERSQSQPQRIERSAPQSNSGGFETRSERAGGNRPGRG